jgi:CTP synthase (UTP-ammonia lyase)
MRNSLTVGIIGDFNPASRFHLATDAALRHAASALALAVDVVWLPTPSLEGKGREATLAQFDALWCAPGSPYASMDGALQSIRFARERGRPFVGTWGGFQHTLVEYARTVLGIADAEHEESAPDASDLVISRLSCSLVGTTQTITLTPGSLAHRLYGQTAVTEVFACNFGLNPHYRDLFQNSELRVSGIDADDEVRMVELPGHPFFVATLFLPQVSSSEVSPHPLITGYLRAAL